MAISTFKRYEKKYSVTDEQLEKLFPLMTKYMNYDAFCLGGNEYGVYNIYFDTPDNFLIRESLSKPYYKEKLRLRSYYSPCKPDDICFLEIKKKIGGLVTKRRITVTFAQAMDFLEKGIRPDFTGTKHEYINTQVLREIEHMMEVYPIIPKQYISYQRFAFFGKEDNQFRLTFDRDITSRRTDLTLASESYGDKLLRHGQHLLEIKINGAMPMWLSYALSELGIFKISFSKYGTAYSNLVKNNPDSTIDEAVGIASGGSTAPQLLVTDLPQASSHNLFRTGA